MAAPINAPATARPAPAATGRVRAVQPWGFAVRELRYWLTNYRRTWRGSVISSVLGPVLYLSAMGAGLGTLVNRHSSASLGGVTYLAFISPGLLAATAMQTAFGESHVPGARLGQMDTELLRRRGSARCARRTCSAAT